VIGLFLIIDFTSKAALSKSVFLFEADESGHEGEVSYLCFGIQKVVSSNHATESSWTNKFHILTCWFEDTVDAGVRKLLSA
jgi:hypothetical protein